MFILYIHSVAFVDLLRRSTAITEGDHLAQSLHAALPQTAHSQGTAAEKPRYITQPARPGLLDCFTGLKSEWK